MIQALSGFVPTSAESVAIELVFLAFFADFGVATKSGSVASSSATSSSSDCSSSNSSSAAFLFTLAGFGAEEVAALTGGGAGSSSCSLSGYSRSTLCKMHLTHNM